MMNPMELKQIPALCTWLIKNNCTDLVIMSAHTFSRYDLLARSGMSSIIGEFKFRSENLEDFGDTMIEKDKHDELFLAARINAGSEGVPFYMVESKNLILLFDLRNRDLNWHDKLCQKNSIETTMVWKPAADLNVLSADFIIVKKESGYYRIPKTMLFEMYQLRNINRDLLCVDNNDQPLIIERDKLQNKIRKEFGAIVEQSMLNNLNVNDV